MRCLTPSGANTPRNYINAGVAEQNMVGMAAGLARLGFALVYGLVPLSLSGWLSRSNWILHMNNCQ